MTERGAARGSSRRPARDLLRAPIAGRFLRWRHARTTLQAVCLGLAAVIVLDGLLGPSLASRNLAGVVPWIHWRGFVVLGLLVAGNLFCMACPFMLPRRLAKRILPARLDWPAPLRSKWLAVGLLALFFWAYEAFALWESPWLTAWVVLAYFAGAFAVDGLFRGASFCRHVCPIGQFHFVGSMVSPLEVRVRDPGVCDRCETLDCIRGRYAPRAVADAREAMRGGANVAGHEAPGAAAFARDGWGGRPIRPGYGGALVLAGEGASGSADAIPAGGGGAATSGRALGREGLLQGGCEMALFQPRKEGNLDCTFCMECIHACPHDNVGISWRSPVRDASLDPVRSGVGRISRRPDLAALALLLTFAAFVNAFGMVAPVHAFQAALGDALGIGSRTGRLLLFFGIGLVALPAALTSFAAWSGRRLAGGREPLVERIGTYAWGLVPLGFGMWTAHYLFHLMTGALTIVPVVQRALADLGLVALRPVRHLGPIVPESWIFPIEVGILQVGLLLTLAVSWRIARRTEGSKRLAVLAWLPWALLATALAVTGAWLLDQPMEMRGTMLER